MSKMGKFAYKMAMLAVFMVALGLVFVSGQVFAATEESQTGSAAIASDITDACEITISQAGAQFRPIEKRLIDAHYNTYATLDPGTSIQVTSGDGSAIGALYIVFNYTPERWRLTVGEQQTERGTHSYLHEYVDAVDGPSAIMTFPAETQLCDVYVFSQGIAPDWVQVWQPAEGHADVLFCPTHSDDDQLYLGGIIPTALDAGYSVQTAYLTTHWTEPMRPHELLNSLWNNGLTRYPYMGYMPDLISRDVLADQDRLAQAGWPRADIVGHQVELLRTYQPQIVVCHSLTGEYGHPAHILNAETMQEAVLVAGDSAQYPKTAEQYGVWDVPKVYIHELKDNQIVLDLDVPLQKYQGKTAFQIMQESFQMHISQMRWDSFRTWLLGHNTAASIAESDNSPCYYGLWRTTVGPDTLGNTMFENIISYEQQAAMTAEAFAHNAFVRNVIVCVCALVVIVIVAVIIVRRRKRARL